MTEKTSPLHSIFVIDGVQQEFTPAQLLDAVTEGPSRQAAGSQASRIVADETLDPVLKPFAAEEKGIRDYLQQMAGFEKSAPLAASDCYTRCRVASALIDAIWRKGSFRIGDLLLRASWRWNTSPVGAAAAFFASVQAAADYLDALGLQLAGYKYSESSSRSEVSFQSSLSDLYEDDGDLSYNAFHSEHPLMSDSRACPPVFDADPQSWIIYIPFDSCDFRLGGSLFAQAAGFGGGTAPQIDDADYLIDCYEVVRELVEDRIVISGGTVSEGGLLSAVNSMAAGGSGMTVDISDLLRAYQGSDEFGILFAEVPGVLIQIRDADFDYVDAELLLQDVAYFPLGHPLPGSGELKVKASAKTGIQTILESLMQNAEGED